MYVLIEALYIARPHPCRYGRIDHGMIHGGVKILLHQSSLPSIYDLMQLSFPLLPVHQLLTFSKSQPGMPRPAYWPLHHPCSRAICAIFILIFSPSPVLKSK